MVDRADGAEYSLTECVYPDGPSTEPAIRGNLVRYRDLAYVGILSSNGATTGVNRGVVDIDLNQDTGVGTIKGTMAVRDDVLGEFEGRFQGNYQRGVWQGKGWATGVGRSAGKLLKVDLTAFDPSRCPTHGDYGAAMDAAEWSVVIAGSDD